MAMTFKQLAKVAMLYYEHLPDREKSRAATFFKQLDTDGNGGLTLPELLASDKLRKFGKDTVKHIFFSLDEDGKDYLGFEECVTLYYLCLFTNRSCSKCGRAVLQGLGYTCFLCFSSSSSDLTPEGFELCLKCFSKGQFSHEHEAAHILHDFVFFDELRQSHPPPPVPHPTPPAAPVVKAPTLQQCIVCGDFHKSDAEGFMFQAHMIKKRGTEDLVCEWCFSYFCFKCGKTSLDSTTRAEPGKWMQKMACPTCHKTRVPGDHYDRYSKQLKVRLGRSELLTSCKTCKIKYKNGMLFHVNTGENGEVEDAGDGVQGYGPGPSPQASNMERMSSAAGALEGRHRMQHNSGQGASAHSLSLPTHLHPPQSPQPQPRPLQPQPQPQKLQPYINTSAPPARARPSPRPAAQQNNNSEYPPPQQASPKPQPQPRHKRASSPSSSSSSDGQKPINRPAGQGPPRSAKAKSSFLGDLVNIVDRVAGGGFGQAGASPRGGRGRRGRSGGRGPGDGGRGAGDDGADEDWDDGAPADDDGGYGDGNENGGDAEASPDVLGHAASFGSCAHDGVADDELPAAADPHACHPDDDQPFQPQDFDQASVDSTGSW